MKNNKSYLIPLDSNFQIEKFVRYLMIWWKITISRKILRDCLESLKLKWYSNPSEYFLKALNNVMPSVEVKAKRIWWAIYQIPTSVSEGRQFFLASKWIINWASSRKWMPMAEKLALEINDALNDTWYAFKKKTEVFNMAQSNKAFSHLSWV